MKAPLRIAAETEDSPRGHVCIVPIHPTRFAGFDDKIISMYSRGMTTREIEGHLKEM